MFPMKVFKKMSLGFNSFTERFMLELNTEKEGFMAYTDLIN